jgi:hypothetical protein
MRTAKKPNNTKTTERVFPGSIVFTAKPHSRSSEANEIHIRPGDRGPKFISLMPWCTGEDSNLRSSKERQIYSLLPLTTRPPVHNSNFPVSHHYIPQTISGASNSEEIKTSLGNDCGGIFRTLKANSLHSEQDLK